MNRIQLIVLATAVSMAAAATSAWSQTGSTPDSAPAAASAAPPATTGGKADRALRRKVYAAIGKHKEIGAGDISVRAKAGAVTLYGTVTDASQIDKVAEIAKGVPGVTSVTNKLSVRKPLGGM